MAERIIFEPCWLYNEQRRSELVTESARYHALLKEGWFPAEELMAHGIETHPSLPHQEMVQMISMGQASDLVATTQAQQNVLKEVEDTLLQIQTAFVDFKAIQDAQERLLQTMKNELEDAGAVQESTNRELLATLEALTARVSRIERAPTPPAFEKPPPPARKP